MNPALLFHALDHFASDTPQHCAFSCRDQTLSYAQLASRSNQLANALRDHGVRRGDRVGIFSQQSLHLPVAVFAAMKAGAAYVPIDPMTPAARLQQVIADTGLRVLVSEDAKLKELQKIDFEGLPLTALVGSGQDYLSALTCYSWRDINGYETSRPDVELNERDLAYIMMTSGSTGTPKGIMHTHYSGLSYAKLAAATYGVTASDKIGSFSPLHFDISTFAYFAGTLRGATSVLIPEEALLFPASLLQLVQAEGLTIWYSAPFVLVQIARQDLLDDYQLSQLRWLKFAGEVLHPKYLRQLMRRLPATRFSNAYGPAETNVCTYQHFDEPPQSDDPLPIGKAWQHTEALVVDGQDQPVACGQQGELLISSPTMMTGYWNRPELNARIFFTRAEPDGSKRVFYRTGDLVTAASDGTLVFIRRKDQQVKVRGYRVELEEIEAALVSHPGVEEAVAFVTRDAAENNSIKAVVTSRDNDAELIKTLRRHAAGMLPRYAVPSAIELVHSLPRTSSGKVDRLAVHALYAVSGSRQRQSNPSIKSSRSS